MDTSLLNRIFPKVESPQTKHNGHDVSGSFTIDGHEIPENPNSTTLKYHLQALYRRYIECVKENFKNINGLAESLKIRNESLGKEIEQIKNIILRIKTEVIPGMLEQIEKLKEEVVDIKANPQKYLGEKNDKTSFYIGTIILVLLTGYLIVFYSSASFSAFFRVFEPGVNVREAMLDPNTFIKAFNDGIGELMFILLMPFVFLALGWLIKKFIERELLSNYVKVLLLLSVTFVFDGFLAYKITEGIESVNQTLLSEEYTVTKALHEVNFWVVIFCGFVTYIVWGLVFDFVMKAHQNSDRKGILIKLKNEKIRELENSIFKANGEIENYEKQIDTKNLEIANNNETILKPVISAEDIRRIHDEFMCVWLKKMQEKNMSPESYKEADQMAEYCIVEFIFNITKPYYNEDI